MDIIVEEQQKEKVGAKKFGDVIGVKDNIKAEEPPEITRGLQ